MSTTKKQGKSRGSGTFRVRTAPSRRKRRETGRPGAPHGSSIEDDLEESPAEDVLEFLKAVDEYKRRNARLFPSLSEILRILRSLGYRRP